MVREIKANFAIEDVHQRVLLRHIMYTFEQNAVSVCWHSLYVIFICLYDIPVSRSKCYYALFVISQNAFLIFGKLLELHELIFKLQTLDVVLFYKFYALFQFQGHYWSEIEVSKYDFGIMGLPINVKLALIDVSILNDIFQMSSPSRLLPSLAPTL